MREYTMTMRTYRYFTCPNGHKGTAKTSENDQPYSTAWESVTTDGMREAGKDVGGYVAYTCLVCREPMTVDKKL